MFSCTTKHTDITIIMTVGAWRCFVLYLGIKDVDKVGSSCAY